MFNTNSDNEQMMSPEDFYNNCECLSRIYLRVQRLWIELDLETKDWIQSQLQIVSEDMTEMREKLTGFLSHDIPNSSSHIVDE
jgi:hypothetical protein